MDKIIHTGFNITTYVRPLVIAVKREEHFPSPRPLLFLLQPPPPPPPQKKNNKIITYFEHYTISESL